MEQPQEGFFNYIRRQYSNEVCIVIKNYIKMNEKLASFTARRIFLTRCRRYGVFPNHIINNIKFLFTNIEPHKPFTNKIQNLVENFKRKALNIEIEMTFWQIKEFNRCICNYKNELESCDIDSLFLNDLYARQARFFKNSLDSHSNIVNRKFNEMVNRQLPVLDIANKNACRNITSINVPNNVLDIVSLGPKFNLPYFDKVDIPNLKMVAQTESIIQNIENEHQRDIVRFKICHVFQSFLSKKCTLTMKEKHLQILTVETRKFLKNNPDIIVLSADKGNMSVIMLKSEYDAKIMDLLQDEITYQVLNKDPTLSYQNLNNKKIRYLFSQNYINRDEKLKLTTYTSVAPKFYGLPKIHKDNHPLRPIVSFTNSPTYKTSKYLADLLKVAIDDTKYNCKNSFELVEFIKEQDIPQNYVLISLDVVSLFTNIDLSLALDTVSDKWLVIEPHTDIPRSEFLDLLAFCLKSGYFSASNIFYKQINGVAMGSPLSPIIADILMEVLLDTVLNSINFNILFVKKYVDDLLLCVPEDKIIDILSKFNNNYFGLKFTLELETDNKLPFLDTLLIRKNNGKIDTVWYAKKLSSGRILNFNSFHPFSQIINTAFGFINRVKKLTTDTTVDTDEIIKNYLTKNKYPKFLINKLINRFNQINHVPNTISNNNNNNNLNLANSPNQIQTYKPIFYVKGLTERISETLRNFNINCQVIFSASNPLRKVFSQLKDSTPELLRSNLVYLIPCGACTLKYVGTTKQILKNRISQHKSDCKVPIRNPQATTLCQHSYDTGHRFDFAQVKILEYEKFYKNRIFLEMAHILGNQEILVNKKSDTDNLSKIYSGIIDSISKLKCENP